MIDEAPTQVPVFTVSRLSTVTERHEVSVLRCNASCYCLVSTLLPLWVPYVTCYATHLFFQASIFTLDLVMEVSIFACPTFLHS